MGVLKDEIIKVGATVIQHMPEGYTRIEISKEWGSAISVREAREVCKAIYDVNDGKKCITMVVGTNAKGINIQSGVNQEFSNNVLLNSVRMAEALVIDHYPDKLMIDLYVRLNPRKKMKVFKKEEKAKEWLLKQKEKLEL